MAFPQACLLGYELCDGHAGVSHPEMSLRESQALRRVAKQTAARYPPNGARAMLMKWACRQKVSTRQINFGHETKKKRLDR
jgi:hypothetical protein